MNFPLSSIPSSKQLSSSPSLTRLLTLPSPFTRLVIPLGGSPSALANPSLSCARHQAAATHEDVSCIRAAL